ncbi:hypothetical protein J2W45_003017 [Leifsonia shinshuensis]|nr:hypothetical protein [Leifsonia shinshuensis]
MSARQEKQIALAQIMIAITAAMMIAVAVSLLVAATIR